MQCNQCKFWDIYGGSSKGKGACRRFPPVATSLVDGNGGSMLVTTYPMTRLADWCGEFQPLQAAQGPSE